MQPVLVKIDVAVVELRRTVRAIYAMADGGTRLDKALCWVFDLAQASRGVRRDLRFWHPELLARGGADTTRQFGYSGFQLQWVIKRILPESRPRFSAGEVSELFQIRHNTRAQLLRADGLTGGRAFYRRQTLVEFLQTCWVGRAGARPADPAQNLRFTEPRPAIPHVIISARYQRHNDFPGTHAAARLSEPVPRASAQPAGTTKLLC
jgi:hypothetical protein